MTIPGHGPGDGGGRGPEGRLGLPLQDLRGPWPGAPEERPEAPSGILAGLVVSGAGGRCWS